jgi:hypothetical protein
MRAWLPIVACGGFAACSGGVSGRLDTDYRGSDLTAPNIQHTPITAGQPFGAAVAVSATVADENDVQSVTVVYRKETEVEWKRLELTAGAEGAYSGSIPGEHVGSAGMYYFLEAADEYDNLGCLPEDCEEDAWRFGVTAPAAQ